MIENAKSNTSIIISRKAISQYYAKLSADDVLNNSHPITYPYPSASQSDRVIVELGDDATICGDELNLNGSKFTIVHGEGILIAYKHVPSYTFSVCIMDPNPRLRKLNNLLI